MPRSHPLAVMLTLAVAGALSGPGSLRAADSAPVPEPYTLKTHDGEEHPAELLRFQVPESRSRPSARTIQVAVLRLKTRSKTPGAPVFVLAGGPGIPGIGLGRSPLYFRLFDRLRDQGDVYLIDQRGTGMSDPSLLCAPHPLDTDLFVSEAKAGAALQGLVRACAEEWRSRGVDLGVYNTIESAHDLEQIRRALGVGRIRLLGMSYGSELALVMIRLHGDRVERAVLAGVRGPRTALKLPETLDLQMRRVATLIAQDSVYASLLPDANSVVGALLQVLERKPFTIVETPRDGGAKREYRVGPAGLQMVLQSDLTDPRAVTLVPAMLHLMKQGDPRIFLKRLRATHESMSKGTSLMSLAVNCATCWDPGRLARVRAEAEASPFGNIRNLYLSPEICATVGVADLGAVFRAPIVSNTPVLFVTGSLDATTPPFEAEEIAWGFPRSAHMVVHNGFHDILHVGEVQKTVVEYFAGKDARGRSILMPPPKFVSVDDALKRLNEETPTSQR